MPNREAGAMSARRFLRPLATTEYGLFLLALVCRGRGVPSICRSIEVVLRTA